VDLSFKPRHRITDDQDQKAGVADFALWKAKKPGEPFWNFKLKNQNFPGRPGWHIECSVMSSSYLGLPFDIHTGGVDLIFPHHENEIAQSGGQLAKYFVHHEHLLVNGRKMSKSRHNYLVLADIPSPMAFRYLCLSTHFQSKMNFSFKSLQSAQARLANLTQFARRLQFNAQKVPSKTADYFKQKFKTYLEDNLNLPQALAVLAEMESKNEMSSETLETLRWMDKILGLGLIQPIKPFSQKELNLQRQRNLARQKGDFALSDKLRLQLKKLGINSQDRSRDSLYWRD